MMMADSPKFPDWLPLLVAVGLLCGCAAFPAGMERREPGAHYLPPDRSLEVMDRLDGLNRSLATFKGVGKANLAAEGQRRSARIVWVGMAPDKLRIEILGVPGQPAASIALDGEWITFDPHTPDRFYRRRIGDDSLQPILSIAINAPDLIDLLRGRLPIRDHATAVLFRPPGAGGFVLQLEKRWWGIQQKIFLDDTLTEIRRVEVFSPGRSLAYSVDFDRTETIDGYRVPRRLVITGGDGNRFELDIERYMANAAVDPSVFVLTPRS